MHLAYHTFDMTETETITRSEPRVTEGMMDAVQDVLESAYCGGGVYALDEEILIKVCQAVLRVAPSLSA